MRDWPLTLPLAILLIGSGVLVFRTTRARVARDLFVALAAGLIASLLINDATGFMLVAGIACASAIARFTPTGARVRPWVLMRVRAAPSIARSAGESSPR